MMIREDILNFIDLTYNSSANVWSEDIYSNLKKKESLEIIEEIVTGAHKEVSESVFLFLSALRFISPGNRDTAFTIPAESEDYSNFIHLHKKSIISLGLSKKNQANNPERALPILEILARETNNKKLAVIELGCSFGLIGYCLLHYQTLVKRKDEYFCTTQQIPEVFKQPETYLGIDIDPPEKKWMLSCLDTGGDRERVERLLEQSPPLKYLRIQQGDALVFSSHGAVKSLIKGKHTPVLLTSFFLYMLTGNDRDRLIGNIMEFIQKHEGYWINQYVDITSAPGKAYFYTQLNGKNIITLRDDRCTAWDYL